MALRFVQILPVVAHDLILAETRWDSEARRFRGPPKRALVSWVSQVDWKCMEDNSISPLQQLRARSSVVTTALFLRFGYAPGHFPVAPFLEHLPEKPSKWPLEGGSRQNFYFANVTVAQARSPGRFFCMWSRNYALHKGAKVRCTRRPSRKMLAPHGRNVGPS